MIEAGDDWTENIRSRADAMIWVEVEALSGVAVQREIDHTRATTLFGDVLRHSGAEVRAETVASWRASVTGQHIVERLKKRDYSSSWKIPDAVMPALLERVTPKIAELFGGLDTVVEYERSFSMRYAKLPG
jgi:hypothetical protein